MFDSIKTRLIGLCVTAVLLTLLTATAANFWIVRGHTQAQIRSSLDDLAQARGETIAQWVRTRRDIVAALASAARAADPRIPLIQAANSGGLDSTYIGFADKRIVFNTDVPLPPDYDPTGRPWYTLAAGAQGAVLTDLYMDASRHQLVVTFARAIKDGDKTLAVVAADALLKNVVDTVDAIKPTPNGFAFLVSSKGIIIAHPDAKLALRPMTDLSSDLGERALQQLQVPAADWIQARIKDRDFLLRGVAIANTEWVLITAADKSEALASLRDLLRAASVVLLSVLTLAVLLTTTMVSALMRGLDRIRAALDEISASGDLTHRLPQVGEDELARTAVSFNLLVEKIQQILLDVRSGSNSIITASGEIALGAQDLSQRTEQTAANLQEAAASMEQLTGTVRQTADAALSANQLASSASAAAAKGGEVVGQVVRTMEEINGSSRKINDITGVIDSIAFQTNILALNAAVEAARAGEQGRGFAVVASEVRSLAQRSAEAAREIKSLIGASVERVETGSRLVQEAGHSMTAIVSSVRRVSDIIGEITAAASEQSQGIGQVSQSVQQLDQMTQQNAALVEQSAAAAESLKHQAEHLAEAVGKFKISHGAATASSIALPSGAAAVAPAQARPRAPQPQAEGAWQGF